MSTHLKPGQTLKREVTVEWLDVPLVVTISSEGIKLQAQGSRKQVTVDWAIDWFTVANHAQTPTSVPAKHWQRPIEFLQAESRKKLSRSGDTG